MCNDQGRISDRRVGLRLRALRENRNLVQLHVANQLKITEIDLGRIEAGDTHADGAVLLRAAKFFGVELALLRP